MSQPLMDTDKHWWAEIFKPIIPSSFWRM